MTLTVIVPFHNGHATIGRLLASLPVEVPVVLVDDHSNEGPQVTRPNVRVIRPAQRGYFSGAVNAGLRATTGDVLVLNQDVWLEGEAWRELLGTHRADHALIGDGVMGHPAWPNGYVQGTFMFMRRDAVERLGLLNERDYPLWGATCEWQLRACRQGFRALPTQVPGLRHERGDKPYGSSIRALLAQQPEGHDWFIRTPPAISVIVACHNYGRYLPDAIASLVGGKSSIGQMAPQSFQSFEVIIVDDASTDETPRIGAALADLWQGIHYLRLDRNVGTPNAYNAGVRASHGRFLTMLSADDMRESWSLEALYRVVEANPRAVAYDDIRLVAGGERGKVWQMPTYSFSQLRYKNQMHAGILFSRKAWEEVGGYPTSMVHGREDWAINVALGLKGYCGVRVDRPGYLYRREGQGRTMTNSTPKWRQRFLEQLQGLYPEAYREGGEMACSGGCGGGSPAPKQNGARSRALMPGAEGMVLVDYLGGNVGNTPYYGVVTKTRYVFSALRKTGYVDHRDVNGLLELMERRRLLFRLSEETERPATLVPVGVVGDASLPEAPTSGVATNPPALQELNGGEANKASPALDPATLTVAELEAALTGLGKEELTALLAAEEQGKARKGALDAIQAALGATGAE